jgi:hypothetical protein
MQYRVGGVHPTGLTVARGVHRCPQGSPQALASAGRRRGQRSNLCNSALWRDGYCVCGICDGAAGPVRAKTSSPGRKMFPGPSRGGARGESEETSGSENKTRLVAAGPLGANLAVCRGDATARHGIRGHACLEAADGHDLVPGPDSDVEGTGPAVQDSVGAALPEGVG